MRSNNSETAPSTHSRVKRGGFEPETISPEEVVSNSLSLVSDTYPCSFRMVRTLRASGSPILSVFVKSRSAQLSAPLWSLRKLKTAATGMFGMEPRLGLASGVATAGALFLRVDLATAHCKVKNAVFPCWVLAIHPVIHRYASKSQLT